MRAVAFMLTLLASTVVLATENGDPAEARQHYQRATIAYNLQDWRVAIDEFRGAYAESGDAVLLFNIGQCLRQLGEYDAASRSYRAYLTSLRDATDRDQVRALIDQMDEAARAQRRLQAAPPPGTIAPGRTMPISVKSERRHWYRSPAGWTLTTIGIVGIAVGGAVLGWAADAGRSASRATSIDEQLAWHQRDLDRQSGGWPTLGVGIASLTVGVIIFGVEARK